MLKIYGSREEKLIFFSVFFSIFTIGGGIGAHHLDSTAQAAAAGGGPVDSRGGRARLRIVEVALGQQLVGLVVTPTPKDYANT